MTRAVGEMTSLERLRWRLTAWYVVTFSVILVVLGAVFLALLTRQLATQLDETLRESTTALAVAAADVPMHTDEGADALRAAVAALPAAGHRLYLLTPDGRRLAGPDTDARIVRAATEAARVGEVSWNDVTHDDAGLLVHARPVTTRDGVTLIAVAAGNRVEWEDRNRAVVSAFALAGAFAILLVGSGGYFLARQSTAPVERAFAYMRRFMADAAHELRTPLTVVRSRIGVTLRQERAAGDYKTALEEVAVDSDRLARIVEDLLTLARADAGERAPERTRVFLDDIVSEAVAAAGVMAQAKGVGVTLEEFEEAAVSGSPTHLHQLVVILLDNAIKFTPAGGRVKVRVGAGANEAFVAVTDTGCGIGAADLPHIFERFYRADAARSRVEGAPGSGSGVGLGLSIARWICDTHGATIDVQSVEGQGTTVTAHFPLA